MEPKKESEINRGRERRARRHRLSHSDNDMGVGGGAPLTSHLFIQIYRELWGPRGPPPASMPQGGAREGHLSPQVTPWGLGGWPRRSAGSGGGGRGGRLPRGHHLSPGQSLALEALGSVWKPVLRELEGRVGDWACFRGGPGRALPLRTAQGPAGSTASRGDSEQGCRGLLPAQLPFRSGKTEKGGQGFKERIWHLLASWKS